MPRRRKSALAIRRSGSRAISEVHQAPQTGVVDGTDKPHSTLYPRKVHAVQQHMIIIDHNYLGDAAIVNRKFGDRLPPELHTRLEMAMQKAADLAPLPCRSCRCARTD